MKTIFSIYGLLLSLIVIVLPISFNKVKAQTLPTASFTYTLGTGGTVNFNSTSTNTTGLNCVWHFGDGSQLSGNTSPVHTYSASGYYAVILIIQSSQGVIYDSITKGVLVNSLATGMGPLKAPLEITLSAYPSPANQEMTVGFSNIELVIHNIEFTDLNGKCVKSICVVNRDHVEVPTSDLQTGVYLIRAHTDKGLITKRVVIAHE